MKLELTNAEWRHIAVGNGWSRYGSAEDFCRKEMEPADILADATSLAMAKWRVAYARACRHDNITTPNSHLVIFSKDNPHIEQVSKAAMHYFTLANWTKLE
jgi:hypothetical protein